MFEELTAMLARSLPDDIGERSCETFAVKNFDVSWWSLRSGSKLQGCEAQRRTQDVCWKRRNRMLEHIRHCWKKHVDIRINMQLERDLLDCFVFYLSVFLFVQYSKCWCCSIVGSLVSEDMTTVFCVFPSHIGGDSHRCCGYLCVRNLWTWPNIRG